MTTIKVKSFALMRRGEEVLVCIGFDSKKGQRFARLPGGHVEFDETSADAVRREMMEEFGVAVAEPVLLGWVEEIFEYEGARGHELVAIYEVAPIVPGWTKQDHPKLLDAAEEWSEAVWISPVAAQAQNLPLYPAGAAALIAQRPVTQRFSA